MAINIEFDFWKVPIVECEPLDEGVSPAPLLVSSGFQSFLTCLVKKILAVGFLLNLCGDWFGWLVSRLLFVNAGSGSLPDWMILVSFQKYGIRGLCVPSSSRFHTFFSIFTVIKLILFSLSSGL